MTKEELDKMFSESAEAMGVSVATYREFIKAADEAMTLALNLRELNKLRAVLGI